MKKKINTLISLSSGIVLLVILWGLYASLFLYSFQSKAPEHHFVVPENASLVVELDGRDVLFDFLNSTFIKGEGDEIVQLIKNSNKKTDEPQQFGINWLQPVIYFQSTYKQQPVKGIIVQIINAHEWKNNSTNFFNQRCVSQSDENSGIIVHSNQLPEKELQQFAQQLYKKEVLVGKKLADNHIVQLKNSSNNWQSNIDVQINDTAIVSKGTVSLDKSYASTYVQYKLTPADFHFTTDVITDQLNDSLQKLIGTNLALVGVSFNYRGIIVDNINNEMALIPDADFVLSFKQATTMEQFVSTIPNAVFSFDKETVTIGKRIFHIRQLSKNSIYFGKTKNPELHPNRQHVGLYTKGALKPLITIEGSKLVQAIVRMSAPYVLATELSNEVVNCTIALTSTGKNTYDLDAVFRFKGKEARLSLLKVVLKAAQ